MYRIRYPNGLIRVYNLRHIKMVELNRNEVTIQFTGINSLFGINFLGCGSVSSSSNEILRYNTFEDASQEFERITKAMGEYQ